LKQAKQSDKDYPVRLFKTQKDWDKFLSKQYDRLAGVWLRFAKKSSKLRSISYQDAVQIALCHGWIDGQVKSYDEDSWIQKFTPRRPKSIWSKINRAKAEELIKAGQMRPAGLAAIEQAKENGRWDSAYDSPKNATIPVDFQKALDKNTNARVFFATLNSQNQYAILFRIQTTRKTKTRLKRIDQFIAMLEQHEKLHN
jgi:uncharacterized protein YdeI (YjbR/CyaY-like superfamily)